MTYVFLDTNIYLEFKPFYEIKWDKIVNDEFTILVPLVVLSELDKYKTSSNKKKAERAKKLTKKIEFIVEGKEKYSNLEIIYYHPEEKYFTEYGFDKQQQDDKLLATVLSYFSKNPNSTIKLISYDTGVRLRAKSLKIEVELMPETYLIPQELDESTKKLEKLSRELLMLKNRMPKISLKFDGGLEFYNVTIVNKEKQLKAETERQLNNFPIAYLIKPQVSDKQSAKSDFSNVIVNLNSIHFQLSDDQIASYNEKLDLYKDKYNEYLLRLEQFNLLKSNTVALTLILSNDGTNPGTDIDINLHFPDGFDLYDDRTYPEAPIEPKAPYRPKSNFDFGPIMTSIPSFDYYPSNSFDSNNLDTPTITRTNSYDVYFYKKQLKHNHSDALHTLFVVFNKFDDRKSFKIQYRITIGNYPNIVSGVLNVIIND